MPVGQVHPSTSTKSNLVLQLSFSDRFCPSSMLDSHVGIPRHQPDHMFHVIGIKMSCMPLFPLSSFLWLHLILKLPLSEIQHITYAISDGGGQWRQTAAKASGALPMAKASSVAWFAHSRTEQPSMRPSDSLRQAVPRSSSATRVTPRGSRTMPLSCVLSTGCSRCVASPKRHSTLLPPTVREHGDKSLS